MPFRNSSSNSTRSPIKRSRTLKRGADFRRVDLSIDMDFLYVAYRKGSLDEMLSDIAKRFDLGAVEELSKAELKAILSGFFELAEFYVFTARTWSFTKVDGNVPVGLLGADRTDHRLEPHLIWFAWATPRNRIECALKFLTDMRENNIIYMWDRPEDNEFWILMAQYGVLRRIGKSENYWPDGATSVIWQTQGYRKADPDAQATR